MFSIIVVCLNAGAELKNTIQSILLQSCSDYEVILQDGMSTDGCVEAALADCTQQELAKIHVVKEQDHGIYDAMNRAIKRATGDYFLFLNAGDYLYDKDVLNKITCEIKQNSADIYYGYLFQRALQAFVYPAPEINDFTCYRNVPCHQTCIYHRRLFETRGYEIKYNVRADYEHFLWSYYEAGAKITYIPVAVASYEGGGYSETKEHKAQSAKQHREIVLKYMGRKKADKYRWIMWLTLAPLRTKLAESPAFSEAYNCVKRLIYNK